MDFELIFYVIATIIINFLLINLFFLKKNDKERETFNKHIFFSFVKEIIHNFDFSFTLFDFRPI